MFLSNLAINRRVLTQVIILIFVILGLVGYLDSPVDLFPKVDIPWVSVATIYTGAGPREIETLVTKPLEEELSTVEGLKHITSRSEEGLSIIALEFELGIDTDAAAADVRDKVALAEPDLPEDAEKPLVSKFDLNAMPIMSLAVSGNRPPQELYLLADNKIRSAISRVRGVANADIIGGQEREIRIAVDQKRLNALHLRFDDIFSAIRQANLELPSGHITEASNEFTIRLAGKIEELEEFRKIPIITKEGETIRLEDICEIEDTVKEVRELARFQGKPSLGILIQKRSDANTIGVADGIYRTIRDLKRLLPSDIEIEVSTDNSVFIRNSLGEVTNNIVMGIVLTAVCLFFFLHNFRSTLIIAVAMPTSIICTFFLVYLFGFSINMLSMSGLALAVGILVNNAILVLENIHRYLEMGKDRVTAAKVGTSEIAAAVASTTLTNIVVFLPVAFMQSIAGQFFRQFAMVIVFSTIFSLFISYTLTPMLASRFLRETREKKKVFQAWERFYDRLSEKYGRLVGTILRRKALVIGLTVVAFVLSLLLTPLIGFEFFPATDQGSFKIAVETPVGTSLQATDAVVRRVEALAESIPEKEKIFAMVGKTSSAHGGSTSGINLGEVDIDLVDLEARNRSTGQIMNSLRPLLAEIPGASFTLQETEQGGGGGDKPIKIEISGDDIETLNRLAAEIMNLAATVPGAVDIDSDWRSGKPELWFLPDREKAAEYGITVGDIARVLRSSFSGEVASTYRVSDDEFDIRVKLREGDRRFQEQVRNLTLPAADGKPVPLTAVCRIENGEGPTTITRKDRSRTVTVSANVSGVSAGEVGRSLGRLIDEKMTFPEGYSYFSGGEMEMIAKEFGELIKALILAICLTFLMLAGILESWRFPVMIMLSLPLALITILLALFLTGATINIMSLMAIIMLVGLVINNTIVIVDYANHLRRNGNGNIFDAVVQACQVRLRPILMANLTTVIAMIPLALAKGAGGGYRASMGVVSIGGMMGGAFLALIVMPAVYVLFASPREAFRFRKRRVVSSGDG
ncbi:MAG TPA: efflux RND transporter permease subunit [bacterium]|nr:efflux RND transporter permease subunit [bacterium]HPQ65419.1 efflux RND transporter permease subunit [bacterium]